MTDEERAVHDRVMDAECTACREGRTVVSLPTDDLTALLSDYEQADLDLDRLRAGVREALAILTDTTLKDSADTKRRAAAYVLKRLLEGGER